MEVQPSVFLQVVFGALVGGVGAYVAIRERLTRLEEKHSALSQRQDSAYHSALAAANRAHERIDDLLHHVSNVRENHNATVPVRRN